MTQKFRICASSAIYAKAMGYSRRPCSPRNGGGSRAQSRPDDSEDLLQLANPEEVRGGEVDSSADTRGEDRLQQERELGWVLDEVERQVRHIDEAEHGHAHEKARADLLQRRDAKTDEPQASARGEQGEEENRLEQGRDRIREREPIDRKSTRLNSSHSQISYAVFCLKKKK